MSYIKWKNKKQKLNFIFYSTIGLITVLLNQNLVLAQNKNYAEEAHKFTVKILKQTKLSIVGNNKNLTNKIMVPEGSGVVVLGIDGRYYILTNSHVVKDNRNYRFFIFLNELKVIGISKGSSRIVPYDLSVEQDKIFDVKITDLALLGIITKTNFQHEVAKLGDLNELELSKEGIAGYIYGYPASTDDRDKDGPEGLTGGEIKIVNLSFKSTLEEDKNHVPFILYQGYTAEGMSGGSILNEEGNLIGINRGPADAKNKNKSLIGLAISIQSILEKLPVLNNIGIEVKSPNPGIENVPSQNFNSDNLNNVEPVRGLW